MDMPWAMAAIARESILYGNEHRHGVVDERTIPTLVRTFGDTYDELGDPSIASIMTPLAYEQFPYQESGFEEMARVAALLEDPSLGPSIAWPEIFGMELREAVRAAFILRVWVAHNEGRFDSTILDMEHMQEVFTRAAPRMQIETLALALTSSIEEAREANAAVPALGAGLQRFAFNPLIARPLVDLGSAGVWAPQTVLVDRVLYPANLYYRGIAKWGTAFADTLGARTEAYVGRQLGLVAPPSDLHSEITYWEGKDKKKSVDWIWVTPRAVLLVECKSGRLTLGARAGEASLPNLVHRYLVHARDQIDRTAALIRAQTLPFDQFPIDRPIIGMAVTAEPFYLGNSTLVEYGSPSTTPSIAVSLRELEHWVCLPADEAIGKLLEVLTDDERRTWALSQALCDVAKPLRNPILDKAWHEFDFVEQKQQRDALSSSRQR